MLLELGFNYAAERSSELYIQGLIMDMENSTRHLDTKILIALANKKYLHSETQTQRTFYTKDNYM